jgi:hypothetical protein
LPEASLALGVRAEHPLIDVNKFVIIGGECLAPPPMVIWKECCFNIIQRRNFAHVRRSAGKWLVAIKGIKQFREL